MAIATLVLWVLTAAAGLILLMSGSAAKRAAAQQAALAPAQAAPAQAAPAPAAAAPAVTVPPSGPTGHAAPLATAPPATVPPATVPPSGPDGLPNIPRVKVHATPGEHPLLEFSHPLLGLVGLGFWFVFVGTRHAPLAWVSFGILVAAITAGLSWLTRNTLAARRGERPARASFPPRLVFLHGFTASATLVLAVLTAVTASHL